jgi:acetyl-CoA synthetase
MHGVNKGDRVAIYMPMIMETPIAMLACARIGAVHSIVVSVEQVFFINETIS